MRRTLALWLLLLGVYAAAAGREDGYAVVAALALALAYRLALRVVPDPWAIGAAAALGLSPPLLAYDTRLHGRARRRRRTRRRRAAGRAARYATRTGATRSAASRCSARCRGWESSSCRPGW